MDNALIFGPQLSKASGDSLDSKEIRNRSHHYHGHQASREHGAGWMSMDLVSQ